MVFEKRRRDSKNGGIICLVLNQMLEKGKDIRRRNRGTKRDL